MLVPQKILLTTLAKLMHHVGHLIKNINVILKLINKVELISSQNIQKSLCLIEILALKYIIEIKISQR